MICLQNVSLMCWLTTGLKKLIKETSCDLLTKCIFDVLAYNRSWKKSSVTPVVICLQNVSLMCWLTTSIWLDWFHESLWFAYKMYLWCVGLQRVSYGLWPYKCCDLLTKCIFDVLAYNFNNWVFRHVLVVICLQNVSLMCWLTTIIQTKR